MDVKTKPLPAAAMVLGYAGVIPFAALAAALWTPAWQPQALGPLLAYSALILSFLGGVRWGRALESGGSLDFALAVLPSLYAWGALQLPPAAALMLLAAGFVLQWWLDGPGDHLPADPGFRRLRSGLTALVLGCHLLALPPLLAA